MNSLNQFLAKLFISLIRFYQIVISPLLPARCRFYPTCSSYAAEAIELHGPISGGKLALKRLCRCHPWGGSGIDFVPLPLARYRFDYLAGYPLGFLVYRQ